MQDEENLVGRARQGDQKAFAQLYEEHFNKIYRYVVVRIGDKTEAEDMTQQVFLNALQSIASFKWQGTPFAAWLFRIAHNQVVDYFRKNQKQPVALFDESLVESDSNPQRMAENSLDIEQLLSATERLTAAQREVISLRFAGGLAIAEVAKIMGKSQGAVKALQHSAIIALRKTLLSENKVLVAEDNEKD
ncbi:MAG: sigma-70 family RNA polymerase sigma factor [Chloroflexi bacterium]|nr:sigma-70 family RNA polymerase sigma factor [Chloroflexota bacterium]